MLVFRIATQADVLLLASMNERLIRDEGHRSGLSRQSLEPRMSRWLAGDYTAAIFSLDREPPAPSPAPPASSNYFSHKEGYTPCYPPPSLTSGGSFLNPWGWAHF